MTFIPKPKDIDDIIEELVEQQKITNKHLELLTDVEIEDINIEE